MSVYEPQGFGADTVGGGSGPIITVNNLNDSGNGSLRWALEDQTGQRRVHFATGGRIQLLNEILINGDVTIEGHTAPSPVVVSGARLRVGGSETILRGLHCRPGEDGPERGDERDGISVGRLGTPIENVVIDSNSISWSIDEGISVWGDVKKVTISRNIVAEALDNSIHEKGDHSMSVLFGSFDKANFPPSKITLVENLIAHGKYRNPRVSDDAREIDIVNNLIYNWGVDGMDFFEDLTVNVIGNVMIPGKDTNRSRPMIALNGAGGATKYYIHDNGGATTGGNAVSRIQNTAAFVSSIDNPRPYADVEQFVLANAGAHRDDRSDIDLRILDTVIKRTGGIIDSPADVGGYDVVFTPDPVEGPEPTLPVDIAETRLELATRNSAVDAIVSTLGGGTVEFQQDDGVVSFIFDLDDPAFAAADNGEAAMLPVQEATCLADGRVNRAVFKRSDGTVVFQVGVDEEGGFGAIGISPQPVFTTGDLLNFSGYVHRQPES